MTRTAQLFAFGVCVVLAPRLFAESATERQLVQALERGLPIVQKAAANYPTHRDCFSCHHQTLPMLAMVSIRGRGPSIDERLLKSQAEFSHATFQRHIKQVKKGQGIGGRALTVAYGLWTLSLVDWKQDETTEAMVTFLLKTQEKEGHWVRQTSRPPLEDSNVMCTTLAIRGLQKYAVKSQKQEVDKAVHLAKVWLAAAPLKTEEDKVARLWSAHLLGCKPGEIKAARAAVLADQREDGGWAQLDSMKSDAYATGQALFVLHETGLSPSEPAYQRGVQYLLKTQEKDGSWLVVTRSRPIQTMFDNGDPHGKNQFISTPATGWALAALACACKPGPAKK